MGNLATNPYFIRLGASLALRFAPRLTFRNTAVFSLWEDVQEILKRDLDFIIAPINQERIERVNGPFVLAMDRSELHLHERAALYKALKISDAETIHALALANARSLLETISSDGTVDAVGGYARPVASRSATRLMGVKGPTEADQMRVARAMFHECFLNLGNDKKIQARAVAASQELRQWCNEEITRRRSGQSSDDDMISRLIETGELDDDGIRRTVSGMFVGAVDTTATCVAQIMAVILKRESMKQQIMRDLDNPERMRGWCWEALRFWPHNPIVLRQAARDTHVGNQMIKAGMQVACFTLAAMHDGAAFPHPEKADPERSEHLYLHFGGGLHPCAGRAINGVQIPLLVTELLRRQPVIRQDVRFDGPFPDRLILQLKA